MFIRSKIALTVFLLCNATAAEDLVILSLGQDRKISVYEMDAAKGTLSLKSSLALDSSPAAMCVDSTGKHLYVALNENGSIGAFEITAKAELVPLSESIIGAKPSYLSMDPSGKFLFSSYYADGKVAAHSIGPDGKLSEKPIQFFGTDERAHSIVFDPSGKFVFVSHTAPNAIFQFVFDPATGKLSPNKTPKLLREPKTGPRHLWFHPTNGHAYGSDEQGCSITTYQLNKETGELKTVETLSSLPEGDHPKKKSTSDIEVHPSGKFVYIANRSVNLIAGFSIDADTGRLKLIQHTPTEAVTRSFNISPDGKHLIAAGQNSGKLAVFRIGEDGTLTRTSTLDAGQNPWWVQFVERGN
jgi:6-phosphogluconolactonase